MAEPLSKLVIELGARTGSFTREMGAATALAKSQVSQIVGEFGKLKVAAGAIFGGAVATKFVSVQREFDVLSSSLKTVTGSSAAAEREMVWLREFAKETPFGLAQATQGFVKMKALGLDPTRASLTSFGNTASAMGKGLDQMIEAVADASTGEFERLKEFGIKASKDGQQVSFTFQGVTKTIRNSSDEIVKYLERIGNVNFASASAERAKTLDGAISSMGDSWDELFRSAGAATGISDALKGAVNGAAGAFDSLGSALRTNEPVVKTVMGVMGAAAVGAGLVALPGAIGAVGGALAGLAAVAAANPIALAVLGVTTAVGGGVAALKAYSRTESGIQDAIRSLQQQNERSEAAMQNAIAGGREGGADRIRATIAERKKAIAELGAEMQGLREKTAGAMGLSMPGAQAAPVKPKGAGDPAPPSSEEKRAAEAGKKLAESLNLQTAALSGDFLEKWGQLSIAYKSGGISLQQLTDAQRELLNLQPFAKAAADEATKAAQAKAAAHEREIVTTAAVVKSLQETNLAERQEIELIGLSEQAQRAIIRAREGHTIALKEEQLARLSSFDLESRSAELLVEEIRLLKERQALGDKRSVSLIGEQEKKDSADWAKGVGDDLKGAFQLAFNSTDNPLKAFGKSLASTVFQRLSTSAADALTKAAMEAAGSASGGLGGLFGGLLKGLFGGSGMSAAATNSMTNGLYMADGGYTGPGGKHQYAGVVHKGEVVWSQTDISRAGGVGIVEAWRRGLRGYANGGVVGASPALPSRTGGGRIIINNYSTAQVETKEQVNEGGGIDTVVLIRQLASALGAEVSNRTGPLYRSMAGQFVPQGAR